MFYHKASYLVFSYEMDTDHSQRYILRKICPIFIERIPECFIRNPLLQSVVSLNNSFALGELEDVTSVHSDFRKILLRIGEILEEFDDECQGNLQYKMISTYMQMVEHLIFTHASRSRNWELHQSSTDDLVRDITNMDRIKYRHMLPGRNIHTKENGSSCVGGIQ